MPIPSALIPWPSKMLPNLPMYKIWILNNLFHMFQNKLRIQNFWSICLLASTLQLVFDEIHFKTYWPFICWGINREATSYHLTFVLPLFGWRLWSLIILYYTECGGYNGDDVLFHKLILLLTHWGRVTHIWVNKLSILGSDNGLSPGRRQAII